MRVSLRMMEGPHNFMDLDEFFAFKSSEVSKSESEYTGDDVSPGDSLADMDDYQCDIFSTPKPQISLDSVWDLSPQSGLLVSLDNDSDEGNGGSVTSDTPSSSGDTITDDIKTSRKRKKESNEGETANVERPKRRKSKENNIENNPAPLQVEELTKACKPQSLASEAKDEKYWTKRRRNNLAAKKSRDQKREKELQIVQRATCLEKENAEMRNEIAKLKKHLQKLNRIVESKKNLSC